MATYNNWKAGLRDIKTPFTAIDYLRWPFRNQWTKDQEAIRMIFRQTMNELYSIAPDQYGSIPLNQILNGLGKTCTKLALTHKKPEIRIALSDFYLMAGIRVLSSGEIQMNHY